MDRGLGLGETSEERDRPRLAARRQGGVIDQVRDFLKGSVAVIVTVGVRVFVRVRVIVAVTMRPVRMRMRVCRRRLWRAGVEDLDPCRRQARTQDARDAELVPDTETAERAPQLVRGQPGVEKRAEQHVARRAGKTIEVQHRAHVRSFLLSIIEQYCVSARIR